MKIHLGVSEKLNLPKKPQIPQQEVQKTQTKYEGKVLKVIGNVKGTLHWFFSDYLSQLLARRTVYNLNSSTVSLIYK